MSVPDSDPGALDKQRRAGPPAPQPEIEADDKVLEMRSHGGSFKSIAETLGFEKSGTAIKAFNRALRRRPASEQETLLAGELHRLDRMEARVRANTALETPEVERRLRAIVRIRAMVSAT